MSTIDVLMDYRQCNERGRGLGYTDSDPHPEPESMISTAPVFHFADPETGGGSELLVMVVDGDGRPMEPGWTEVPRSTWRRVLAVATRRRLPRVFWRVA